MKKFLDGFEKSAAEAAHKTYGIGLGRREKMTERDKMEQKLVKQIAQREHKERMSFHPYHPLATTLGALPGVAAGIGAKALGHSGLKSLGIGAGGAAIGGALGHGAGRYLRLGNLSKKQREEEKLKELRKVPRSGPK